MSVLKKQRRPFVIHFIHKSPPLRVFNCILYSRKHIKYGGVHVIVHIPSSNRVKGPHFVCNLRVTPGSFCLGDRSKARNQDVVHTRHHGRVGIPHLKEIRRITLNHHRVRNRKNEIQKARTVWRNHNVRAVIKLQLLFKRQSFHELVRNSNLLSVRTDPSPLP